MFCKLSRYKYNFCMLKCHVHNNPLVWILCPMLIIIRHFVVHASAVEIRVVAFDYASHCLRSWPFLQAQRTVMCVEKILALKFNSHVKRLRLY